jgi:fucose 4-O-acetylase-like acetyltransferase
MPTDRISWIDNLRFVAIAFVAFGHTNALAPAGVVRYAYTFHLAIFWFLSGKCVLAFLGIAAWFGIAHYLPSWSPTLYLGRASLIVLGLHEVFFDVTYRANRALTALFGAPPFFVSRSHSFWMQLAAGVSRP